jgi:hypothetical protein
MDSCGNRRNGSKGSEFSSVQKTGHQIPDPPYQPYPPNQPDPP